MSAPSDPVTYCGAAHRRPAGNQPDMVELLVPRGRHQPEGPGKGQPCSVCWRGPWALTGPGPTWLCFLGSDPPRAAPGPGGLGLAYTTRLLDAPGRASIRSPTKRVGCSTGEKQDRLGPDPREVTLGMLGDGSRAGLGGSPSDSRACRKLDACWCLLLALQRLGRWCIVAPQGVCRSWTCVLSS